MICENLRPAIYRNCVICVQLSFKTASGKRMSDVKGFVTNAYAFILHSQRGGIR